MPAAFDKAVREAHMSFTPDSIQDTTASARLHRDGINETYRTLLPTIHINKQKEGWELKKLSQKHKSVVALHSQGVSRNDIGQVCGCTPEYVSMIVAQPLAKEYLRELEIYMDSRMKSLYGKTVDVIQSGLNGDATDTQLKAARLQLEATNKLKPDDRNSQSAEDVVAALLKHAAGGIVAIGNVQINQGE